MSIYGYVRMSSVVITVNTQLILFCNRRVGIASLGLYNMMRRSTCLDVLRLFIMIIDKDTS